MAERKRGGGIVRPAVLFVHGNSELYGADYILLEVVRALNDQVRPIVALPSEGQLTRILHREGVQVHITRESVLRRVNFKPEKLPGLFWNIARDVRDLKRIIRREKVVLVYSNTAAVVTGALAARLCKIPNLYHIHEILVRPLWLARVIARMVLSNATEVIAVSNAAREHLEKYGRLGDPPVRVIHNGLDPSPYDHVEDVEKVRTEMGAGTENILFGVIGRIHPGKGQPYFIKSAHLIADVCPQARFVIVGGTFNGYEYLLDELNQQISRLKLENVLKVLPYRTDVPRMMRALDVFVLPSTGPDSLPTVVLEAMAACRPVVATPTGGAREMVLHGETGFLAPWNEASTFAGCMLELAQDNEKRRQMGEAGRRRLEERFSRERFFADVCDCVTHYLSSALTAYDSKDVKIIATH